MVSHPETGSDSPIGSDRDWGRDIQGLPTNDSNKPEIKHNHDKRRGDAPV